MIELRNAIIKKTTLGTEDHGFTAWLHLEWEGGGQGFGGYGLNGAAASVFIQGVLNTVGVYYWEELPGKHVRIESNSSRISRIGHILRNKWFDPAEAFRIL